MMRKIIITISLIVIAGLFVFIIPELIGVGANRDSGYFATLQSHLNERLATASIIFAATKIITGVINLLQDVNVELGIVFAGVNVAPMKILEPINNTISSLSDLFLLAVGAIILEKFLMIISGWFTFKIIIPISLICWSIAIWMRGSFGETLKKFAIIISFVSIAATAVIPMSVELSILVEKYFLSDVVDKAVVNIEANSIGIESLKDEISQKEPTEEEKKNITWWDKAENKASFSFITGKINSILDSAMDKAKNIVSDLVNTIIVLIITTLVIPIGTMIGLWFLLRWSLRIFSGRIEGKTVESRWKV